MWRYSDKYNINSGNENSGNYVNIYELLFESISTDMKALNTKILLFLYNNP